VPVADTCLAGRKALRQNQSPEESLNPLVVTMASCIMVCCARLAAFSAGQPEGVGGNRSPGSEPEFLPDPDARRCPTQRLCPCGWTTGAGGFLRARCKGEWRGMDVDICRAIAAAVLGDATKFASRL